MGAKAQVTVVDSGYCGASGNNLTWILTSDGVLTISGSGDMKSYYPYDIPWDSNKDKIKTVIIGDDVTTIGNYAFYTFSGIKSVKIGNSVTRIGQIAFYRCSNLDSITIPNSVTVIENAAFHECSGLKTITIGNSVTSIGGSVFRNCSSLESMIINTIIPPTSIAPADITFGGTPDTIPIYIPCGTFDSYKNAAGWGEYFTNFKEDCDSTVTIIEVETQRILSLRVYSNPTNGRLIIDYGDSKGACPLVKVVEIYDVVGRKIQSKIVNLQSEIIIDVSHLANGVYFLKVDNKVVRFVKE